MKNLFKLAAYLELKYAQATNIITKDGSTYLKINALAEAASMTAMHLYTYYNESKTVGKEVGTRSKYLGIAYRRAHELGEVTLNEDVVFKELPNNKLQVNIPLLQKAMVEAPTLVNDLRNLELSDEAGLEEVNQTFLSMMQYYNANKKFPNENS